MRTEYVKLPIETIIEGFKHSLSDTAGGRIVNVDHVYDPRKGVVLYEVQVEEDDAAPAEVEGGQGESPDTSNGGK